MNEKNRSKKFKKWLKRNHTFINIIIAVMGALLFWVGISIDDKNKTLGLLLTEIGIALITNAVLLAISLLYFKEDDDYDDAKAMYEEKGIVNAYDTKKAMNEKINNSLLPNYKITEYDILCCGGLTSLRKAEGRKLIDYIKKNKMRIRILTANPHLEYLLQQKIDEDCELVDYVTYKTTPVENVIKHSIFDLYEWVCEQRALLPKKLKDNLQIKFYNSLPPIQFHRVGNHVFVGQSVIGANSQSSPAFEFINSDNPSDLFSRYTEYFDTLWDDPNFAQDTPRVKLNPQLIINNKIINNILKLSSSDIASDLDIVNDRGIRAVFTVCGYPKPLEDGKERRYNTNIVRGAEVVNVQESNGQAINGIKIGYYSQDEQQVLGRCISSGEIKFEVTKEPARYSILAIPFKNIDEKVIAAISFEFDSIFNDKLQICEGDIDIRDKNAKVIEKAQKWAELLAVYLRIND